VDFATKDGGKLAEAADTTETISTTTKPEELKRITSVSTLTNH
jgi:hypothetical protein